MGLVLLLLRLSDLNCSKDLHKIKSLLHFYPSHIPHLSIYYCFVPYGGPGIPCHILIKSISNDHLSVCLRQSFSLFLEEVRFLMSVEPATIWPLPWWSQHQGNRTDRWVADVSAPFCLTTGICPPRVSFRNERKSRTKEYSFVQSCIPPHESWPYGWYTRRFLAVAEKDDHHGGHCPGSKMVDGCSIVRQVQGQPWWFFDQG